MQYVSILYHNTVSGETKISEKMYPIESFDGKETRKAELSFLADHPEIKEEEIYFMW